MALLIFKNGPKNGSTISLRPGLNRIGRNLANDIQIEEPSISSFHCEMHVSPLGVAFRDVGSRNGSFIEGRRVEKEILTGGKTLQLGAIAFLVHVPTAHVAIPEQKKEPEVFANFMPDGTQACQAHAGVAAGFPVSEMRENLVRGVCATDGAGWGPRMRRFRAWNAAGNVRKSRSPFGASGRDCLGNWGFWCGKFASDAILTRAGFLPIFTDAIEEGFDGFNHR